MLVFLDIEVAIVSLTTRLFRRIVCLRIGSNYSPKMYFCLIRYKPEAYYAKGDYDSVTSCGDVTTYELIELLRGNHHPPFRGTRCSLILLHVYAETRVCVG